MFSTGIAWSLLAVERLTDAFVRSKSRGAMVPGDARRYDALLAREGDQIDRVVAGAYLAMRDFELFAAQTMLYFAVVSYADVVASIKRIARQTSAPNTARAKPIFNQLYHFLILPVPELPNRGRCVDLPTCSRLLAKRLVASCANLLRIASTDSCFR